MFDTTLGPEHLTTFAPGSRPRFPARPACLTALLVAEVVLLGQLVDMQAFGGDPRWWARLLGWSGLVPRLAAVVGVATLAFGGRKLRAELGRLTSVAGPAWRANLLAAGHLAAFAGFAAMTARISAGTAGPRAASGGEVLAWLMAGSVTAALWAMAALPAVSWGALIRRSGGVLAAGTFVGVGALLMGQWTQSLWNPLSRSTFWAVTNLLGLAFRDVVCDPSRMQVGTSTCSVAIAPGCSGYEGIGLIWGLLLGSFWLFRGQFRFPRALLLIPIGTALMWVANTLRIAGLVAVGTLVSPRIAAGGFHSQTGWIAFNLVGLGMIVVAQRIPYFRAGGPSPDAPTAPGATAAYLMPLLTLVGASMLTGAFTDGFDRLYPLRMAAVAAAFALYRRDYGAVRPAWSWGAVGIGLAVFALWMALEPGSAGGSGGFDPRLELAPGWALAWLTARVVGSVLIVPLAEELAFRGYLIRRLIAADFRSIPPGHLTWISVAVSSAAFGALHGRWLAGTLAGACYALALRRRGRLGDAVLAHATTNAMIAAYVLATGDWSLWS